MELAKEEQILYRHFDDISRLAARRGIPLFSDFAGLNEMDILYRLFEDKGIKGDITRNYMVSYGGYKDAERQMVCFLPDVWYQEVKEEDFPIECIKISPVSKKFHDALTHRDFLGVVMNAGIERDQIGDIIVKDDGNGDISGYVFCCRDKIPVLSGITRIRHTSVYTETCDGTNLSLIQEFKEIQGSVPSMRLDAVIAVAVKSSRSRSLPLIKEGKVYVNGRRCMEGSRNVCDGDIISVRGYGKYRIGKPHAATKKGRYHITVGQYI